jgi:hypothetical protein
MALHPLSTTAAAETAGGSDRNSDSPGRDRWSCQRPRPDSSRTRPKTAWSAASQCRHPCRERATMQAAGTSIPAIDSPLYYLGTWWQGPRWLEVVEAASADSLGGVAEPWNRAPGIGGLPVGAGRQPAAAPPRLRDDAGWCRQLSSDCPRGAAQAGQPHAACSNRIADRSTATCPSGAPSWTPRRTAIRHGRPSPGG